MSRTRRARKGCYVWAVALRTPRGPRELVFLARHVVGQIQPGPGVARCRWVPVASAPQTLPPPAAELIQHATTAAAQAIIGHQPLDTVARLRVAR